jgi:hypothetical protein
MSLSEEEIARRVERIRAERVAAGKPPNIESPVVYRLLDAVLANHAERQHKEQNPAVTN